MAGSGSGGGGFGDASGGGLPATAWALVRVGRSEETWDVNVLDMHERAILGGLRADDLFMEWFASVAPGVPIGVCSVHVATETELIGAMPVRAVPHLKTTCKGCVHLRIVLPAVAVAAAGGGGVGPIGALLLCARR